jgi:hypothetical protein
MRRRERRGTLFALMFAIIGPEDDGQMKSGAVQIRNR